MKTRSAKNKGKALQNHIRDRVTEVFDLEEDDVISRTMGEGGVDVMLSPAAKKKFPFSVEAKNTKERPGKGELEQAKANAYKNTLGIVVWKPSRVGMKEAIVMVKLEDFMEWWKEQNE